MNWWSIRDPHERAVARAEFYRVQAVTAVNVTVSAVQRSTQFFCDVWGFKKAGERQASGPEISALTGIHATSARIVSLQLGNETLLLTEYENTNGRPMPRDSRSNDRWFQHIAIVVSDINAAAARLGATVWRR